MSDREKLKLALEEVLDSGNYTELFFEDIFKLWVKDGISPEVILREIQALENVDDFLLEDVEINSKWNGKIPVWILHQNFCPEKPDTYFKRGSSSATKDETQFTKKNSPLKGLWHKHYFDNNNDFLNQNIENEKRKHKILENSLKLVSMLSRISEQAVTGEWIIFKKENNINTYLCLAKHDDGDLAIAEKMKKAGIAV
ncbi:MAG: hypothetical protein PHQ03_00740 [Methylococcales bacterium]|nr:hypothetical protein [Methylococcales bacterium]